MLWEADHLTMGMLSAEIWGASFQHGLFPEYIMEEEMLLTAVTNRF